MKRIKTYSITGIITLVSGTKIGGSDDMIKIGGTDKTCIKDPSTGKPYLPGSSLKGRMRASLEKDLGASNGASPSKDGPIARVFGPHNNWKHEMGPTRIRVHDAMLVEDSAFDLEEKTESVNNRQTGAAQDPRTMERVVPGAKFKLRIDFDIYDIDKDVSYKDVFEGKTHTGENAIDMIIQDGLERLCQDGIGSSTSRGYGQIDISDVSIKPIKRKLNIKIAQDSAAAA